MRMTAGMIAGRKSPVVFVLGCRRDMLAGLDNTAADFPGAGKQALQRLAVADANRALQPRQILRQAAQHFQHRLAIIEEYVAPHHRVRSGNAGEVPKTRGRKFDDLGFQVVLEIRRRTDDRIGDQMWNVRGDGQDMVVMDRIHDLDLAAGAAP